jgi:hypothetical protein
VRRLQALCRGALGRRAAGVRKVQRQRLRWALRRDAGCEIRDFTVGLMEI